MGFNVDVGVVPIQRRTEDDKRVRVQLEVDFVCNLGSKRYYIQSAYRMPDEEKFRQEEASLRNINDSFKKIIIVGGRMRRASLHLRVTCVASFAVLLGEGSFSTTK